LDAPVAEYFNLEALDLGSQGMGYVV